MTTFQEARAFLLKHRTEYDTAVKDFRWPDPVDFNWALDWFDAELAQNPESRDRAALWIVDTGSNNEIKLSFAELSRRSNQAANFLRAQGLKRGWLTMKIVAPAFHGAKKQLQACLAQPGEEILRCTSPGFKPSQYMVERCPTG